MANGGNIVINLNLNSANFNRNWNSAMNTVQRGQRQVNSASSSMISGFSKLGKAVVAAFSVKAITDFTMSCIKLGSELSEIQNVVDTVFGSSSKEIDEWAKTAITSFGLSETKAKQYASTLGSMAKSFGFTTAETVEMSKSLTKLIGDVSSFYNLSSDEAFTKIKSVFTGETESLKELGVVMTQTALDEYALANGFGKTTKQMSEYEKVALRQKFVMEKLGLANDDFLRTQDGWANQSRILKLQWEQLMATLGQGFINIFTPLLKGLNELVGTLQNVANGFKEITEAIFGLQEAASGGTATSGIASDMDDVAKSATTAQKAASKMTTSFDELNKVNSSDSSSGSSSISSEIFGNDTDTSAEETENKWKKVIDDIKNMFNPLLQEFKDGFNEAFDPSQLDPMIANIERTGKSLENIFTSDKVQNSFSTLSNNVAKSLGQITGSAASIGTTIGTLITGSIAGYLEENEGFLEDRISSIFDSLGEKSKQIGDFSVAISDIFEVFSSPEAQSIGSNFIEFFVNPLLSGLDLLEMFSSDLLTLVTQPIIDNSEQIKQMIKDLLGPIDVITTSISDFATYTGEAITTCYEEHFRPFIDSITKGISKITSTFLSMWTESFKPVLDNLANKFSELMSEHIEPLVDKIMNFIGKIVDGLKELWENILQPLINWIVENILPILAPIFDTVGNLFMGLLGTVSDVVGDIFDILGGIVDFIVGIFTGNWEKAWNGVKEIFKGVWDSFVDIVKAPLNLIIGIINGLIEKINGALKIEVPDWIPGIGGDTWGVNIPTIPKLAKGAALYKPTLFEGGEYPGAQTNPEIVAPQAAIAEAVSLGLKLSGGNTGQNQVIHVHNYLFEGQEQFSEFIINTNEQYRYRMS